LWGLATLTGACNEKGLQTRKSEGPERVSSGREMDKKGRSKGVPVEENAKIGPQDPITERNRQKRRRQEGKSRKKTEADLGLVGVQERK